MKTKKKTNQNGFYILQGMATSFFQILEMSDDQELIVDLYNKLMESFDDSNEETATNLFFAFMNNSAIMQGITVEYLTYKLQEALLNNDADESEISWVGQILVKKF